MNIKWIGKAEPDLEEQAWFVRGKPDKFTVNPRLIDTHPGMKAVKSEFAKEIQKDTPSRRRSEKRASYFQSRDEYRKKVRECLSSIFEEIRQESLQTPVALKKLRDYDHNSQWRYGLYRGMIYQFDKQGYTTEAMLEGIEQFEEAKSARSKISGKKS